MAATHEEMQAELERLRTENETLKTKQSREMRLQVSQGCVPDPVEIGVAYRAAG